MSLTEDWEDGKLKRSQLYFLKDVEEAANLVAFLSEGNHFYDARTKVEITKRIKVLAPCDYEELQKYKSLAEKGQSAINANKILCELIHELQDKIISLLK